MKRIVNLVGARPQFIKAATISSVIQNNFKTEVEEIIIHSGQHYDYNLSGVFFEQMSIPKPHIHLAVNATSSEEQFDEIKTALHKELVKLKPDAIIIYGDTNTTRAGAEVAHALNIPIAHVEAGLRSYNNAMPEEQNRVIADKLSTILFTPNEGAIKNLAKENIHDGQKLDKVSNRVVENVGDVMIDSLRIFSPHAALSAEIARKLDSEKPVLLVTIHRNYNADDDSRLTELVASLDQQAEHFQVVFPVHPRTAKKLDTKNTKILFLPPVSYFDMLALEKMATIIATDSGGVQKEAYFFQKPLIILRHETEWKELVEHQVARLCDVQSTSLKENIDAFKNFSYPELPNLYGDGHAAERICQTILKTLG